jgi:hypothetical protein
VYGGRAGNVRACYAGRGRVVSEDIINSCTCRGVVKLLGGFVEVLQPRKQLRDRTYWTTQHPSRQYIQPYPVPLSTSHSATGRYLASRVIPPRSCFSTSSRACLPMSGIPHPCNTPPRSPQLYSLCTGRESG